MFVFHQVDPSTLSAVLTHGLKRFSRGEKGADGLIMKTDAFLDERCPKIVKEQGVSRDNNIYAYLTDKESIIDITDGSQIPIKTFIAQSTQAVLRLDINPARCFVSDLDTYDALKAALEARGDPSKAEQLAESYWNKLTPLTNFEIGSIRRPEIMITYDIPADKLQQV